MDSSASKEQASAREEVMKCEQEIQSIKAALRRLGSSENPNEPNSMDIFLLKVEGLPETAKPAFTLQLSSPIEEGTLSEIFDSNQDPAPEGSIVSFQGVETTVATLTVSAKDADIPLGSSNASDLAPLCAIDPMDVKEEYVSELSIAITAEDSSGANTEEAVPKQPICTVTLKVTYKPSAKDQKEELYERLNKTSKRKSAALESLRKISMTMASAGDSPSKAALAKKPSVKPGFLNAKKKEPTRLERLYERTIGPDSLLRKSFGVLMMTKNYIIFFGAVSFFHFKGQMLSLPPPV